MRIRVFGTVLAMGLGGLVWTAADAGLEPHARAATASMPPAGLSTPEPPSAGPFGAAFLYGRVTTVTGATHEGRLRFGGTEEALWGNYFNGFKDENPWAAHTPPERLLQPRPPIEVFGWHIPLPGSRRINLGRPMMARFGDIARIDARGPDLQVTLKSGTIVRLDRYAADDFADGVRIWDGQGGVVNLDEWRVRSIELLPGPGADASDAPLHGTVRTGHGQFTGLIQWDGEQCLGADELVGYADRREHRLRFDTIRAIAYRSPDSSVSTLRDGREVVLSHSREVGGPSRGIYVDDHRYGRVLVSWEAFERVDFSPAVGAPAYADFPPGGALTGRVATRDGRRLAGRLVYDLDESETTETLDAPSGGINYTIPFGMIASIAPGGGSERGPQRVPVTLHSGEALQLQRNGDLADANAGLLIFVEDQPRPEYIAWTDIEQIDFDRPPAIYPPLGGR